MLNFTFHNPTRIYFGKGQVSAVEKEVTGNVRRVLIVTGQGSVKKYGVFQQVTERLAAAGVEYSELEGVQPNPRLEKLRQGIDICRDRQIDLVLAVGGGSVMDTAKAVAAGALYDGDVWDFFGKGVLPEQALPVGTVVTLAATGSEMNPNAVITREDMRHKMAMSADVVRPVFSVLDPEYTFTVNKFHTAAGIADIMAHIFEYYLTPVRETGLQDSLSEALLGQCVKYGPVVCEHPDDYDARAVILWASTLALNGTIGSGTASDWACLGLEHELSAFYDISHGAGLAILLQNYMTVISRKWGPEKLARYARVVWGAQQQDDREAAVQAEQRTRDFFDSLDLPACLKDADIGGEHFDDMVEHLVRTRKKTGRFEQLTTEELHQVLSLSL